MSRSLKSRVLWTDLSAWNNTWYVYVGAPLPAASGAPIGLILGSHVARGETGERLVVGACIAVTMLVGFTLFAAVDTHGSTDS
jgi:hypothetical protein